jgi:hypothetical protein
MPLVHEIALGLILEYALPPGARWTLEPLESVNLDYEIAHTSLSNLTFSSLLAIVLECSPTTSRASSRLREDYLLVT